MQFIESDNGFSHESTTENCLTETIGFESQLV